MHNRDRGGEIRLQIANTLRANSPHHPTPHTQTPTRVNTLQTMQTQSETKYYKCHSCNQEECSRKYRYRHYLTVRTLSTKKQTLNATTYILLESKRTGLQASELFEKDNVFCGGHITGAPVPVQRSSQLPESRVEGSHTHPTTRESSEKAQFCVFFVGTWQQKMSAKIRRNNKPFYAQHSSTNAEASAITESPG